MELLLPLLVVGFIFLLVTQSRRQRKEVRATQELQAGLAVGDQVMTTAGLHATVAGLDEDTVDLEVAPGVVTTWSRLVIRQLVVEEDETVDADDELDDDGTPTTAVDATPADPAAAGTTAADAKPSLRKP